MGQREKILNLERTIRSLHDQLGTVDHNPSERKYVESIISGIQDQYKELTGHFYTWRNKPLYRENNER